MSQKISCAIPIHNMQNAEFFLKRILDSIAMQSYEDIEVVITDNSPDSSLTSIIQTYDMDITYHRNEPSPKNGMASNTNEAIRRSTGELIKILYMDDYLANRDSLKTIAESFTANWLVTGCVHDDGHSIGSPHYPTFKPTDKDNFIGSPSVVTIKNGLNVWFDEEMTWLLDLDFYQRLYAKYEEPVVLNDLNVVIGLHSGQMTNILTREAKEKEVVYLRNKHA